VFWNTDINVLQLWIVNKLRFLGYKGRNNIVLNSLTTL